VLGEIAQTIGVHGGNILEVSHRRTMLNVPPKGAVVEVTMETRGGAHATEIISALSVLGYRVERLDPPPPGAA
jgi:threonine dehydratase